MKLVVATENLGKLNEIKGLMHGTQNCLIPQSELHIASVPETGLTFIENALIKARHACRCSKLPALADDSGLVVPSLHGAPGIYSARYAEHPIQKLLSELQDKPEHERQAYFYCAAVYLRHEQDPTPIIAEGIWPGIILREPRGNHGFGYDPIFYVPDQHCSAAELSIQKKNQLSHRGQALQKLIKSLKHER